MRVEKSGLFKPAFFIVLLYKHKTGIMKIIINYDILLE
jgi:hypothetical protein